MALKGKQKNIDANKDGRISEEDFKILRSRQHGGMKKKMMGGGMMMKPIMANKGASMDSNKRKTFKSLQEMRTAKGFRPGETPKQFNQRKELAKFAKEGVRATRIGKIVLPIALAGVGAVQYLKSKMNKNKLKKKMGGGMMMKPIMANKGKNITGKTSAAVKEFYDTVPPNKDPRMTGAKYRKYLRGLKKVTDASVAANIANRLKTGAKRNKLSPGMKKIMIDATDKILKSGKSLTTGDSFIQRRITLGGLGGRAGLVLKGAAAIAKGLKKFTPSKKMGGGMMNMPGYKKGKSVMAKGCKLGRKKPTKMYT